MPIRVERKGPQRVLRVRHGNGPRSITVSGSGGGSSPSPLVISGTPEDSISAGDPYSFTPTVSGGTAPYSFALAPSTPTGFAFDTDTGALTAEDVEAGGYEDLTITVTDSADPPQTDDLGPFTITASEASPGETSLSFGAGSRSGYGQYPASGSVTGINSSDFAKNGGDQLVPSGSYGASHSFSLSSYDLTVGGEAYTVSITANAVTAAVTSSDTNGADEYELGRYVVTEDWLTLGDTVYCRDGHLNQPNGLMYLVPRTDYAGSGRITIRSENPDATTHADGHTNRQHGFKTGLVYVDPANNALSYPIDFRDVHFYTAEEPTAGNRFLLRSAGGGGYGVYNSRFEIGDPDVAPVMCGILFGSLASGPEPTGFTVDGCLFTGISIGMRMLTGGGEGAQSTFSNNTCIGLMDDLLDLEQGGNCVFTRNFGRDFNVQPGGHPDFLQMPTYAGDTFDTVCTYNIAVRNVGSAGQTDAQFLFLTGTSAPYTQSGVVVQNNISYLTTANGIAINVASDGDCRFNLCLMDPNSTNDGSGGNPPNPANIYMAGTGGVISHNVSNTISTDDLTGATIGPNIQLDNDYATYLVALPNLPMTGIANSLLTRADVLAGVTPADLAEASGGFKNIDGTFCGPLFPAPPGTGNIGPWNDGTVYDPGNPAWVAAHPPAT